MGYNDFNFSLNGSPATSPMGFPIDTQPTEPPPGMQSTVASVSDGPQIINAPKSWWDTIKQDSQSAASWTESEIGNVYQGTKKVVSTVYDDAASGIGTVAHDVTSPLRTTYMYLILGIIVIAGALYFIGKGGAVKANVIL